MANKVLKLHHVASCTSTLTVKSIRDAFSVQSLMLMRQNVKHNVNKQVRLKLPDIGKTMSRQHDTPNFVTLLGNMLN